MLSRRNYDKMCTWKRFQKLWPSPNGPTHVLYAIVHFRKFMCSEVSIDCVKDLVDEHSEDITTEYLQDLLLEVPKTAYKNVACDKEEEKEGECTCFRE